MKRHSAEEILSKLHEAEILIGNGLSQAHACMKIGVSVMTLHRWRKQYGVHAASEADASRTPADIVSASANAAAAAEGRASELQRENERLRRIVTDLILEKMKIEEEFLPRERRLK